MMNKGSTNKEIPKPLKEIIWLFNRFNETKGSKKEKYKQKIINWKNAHPEYIKEYNKIAIKVFDSQSNKVK